MATIVSVLAAWFQEFGQFVREAAAFYWRGITGKK